MLRVTPTNDPLFSFRMTKMKVTTHANVCFFTAKYRRMVRRSRVLPSAIFGVDRKWVGSCRFSSVQNQKKQANSSPSLLRLLSTSPLPIFRVSPTICLSDVLPCLMPITKYAIVGARDPTARKRCRKLQRAPLGLTCRTVRSPLMANDRNCSSLMTSKPDS